MNPGIVADTVVCPDASGWKATPPAATGDADADWPTGLVTVTDCPVAAVVISCAAAGFVCVIVAVSGTPPRRTICAGDTLVWPLGSPTPTWNTLSPDREVMLVGRPVMCSAGCTTLTAAV